MLSTGSAWYSPGALGSTARSGCLTDEEVARLGTSALDPATERRLKVHLDACSWCRKLVAVSAPDVTATVWGATTPSTVRAWPHSAIAPGRILEGKYRIERALGEGGMGYVVEATHLALGTRVAIKLMLQEFVADKEAVKRFAREARAAASLTGVHAVRTLDVGTLATGAPYIVMEYLAGQDLRSVLSARGRLPAHEAVAMILDACEAIGEAHARGILHRDIKPTNLFLAEGPHGPCLKVLDFGLAKTIGSAPDPTESGLTETRAFLGSPRYMSPEQLQSARNVDVRTDIWALGVCLYELLSGRPPFEAENLQMLSARILLESPRPLIEACPDVPPRLAAIVHRCLKTDRAQRYPTVHELALALRAYLAEGPAFPPDVAGKPARGYVVPLAIAAAIVVAGVGVALLRRAPARAASSDTATTVLGAEASAVTTATTSEPLALPPGPPVPSPAASSVASAAPPPSALPASTSAGRAAAPSARALESRPNGKPPTARPPLPPPPSAVAAPPRQPPRVNTGLAEDPHD